MEYLGHDYLFGPEEGTKVIIEIHLLLVALRVVAHPQLLRVSFEADIDQPQGEEQENGKGANHNNGAIVVIEPA